MTFGEAIKAMKDGFRVDRIGWNGKNQWVALQRPDEHSKMSRPYFYIRTVDCDLVPWVPSVSDCLATDWGIAGGVTE